MIIERIIPGTREFKLQYAEHIQRYIFVGGYIKNKSVLDIACGAGYGTYYLAKHGAKYIAGADISVNTIIYAKETYRKDNLDFMAFNAEQIAKINKKFDVIVSLETIEHLKNYTKFIKGTTKVLKSEGILILSTPNKQVIGNGNNHFHIHEFSVEELKLALSKYFDPVIIYGQHLRPENTQGIFRHHNCILLFLQLARRYIRMLIPHRVKFIIYNLIKKPPSLSDYYISNAHIEKSRQIIAVCYLKKPKNK